MKGDTAKDAKFLSGRYFYQSRTRTPIKMDIKPGILAKGIKTQKGALFHNSSISKMPSIRIFLRPTALFGFNIWPQDVFQAYLKSSGKTSTVHIHRSYQRS